MGRQIRLILVNVRSALNVGAVFRSADAMGAGHIYLAGYTPYPKIASDQRLPHIADRASRQIAKTALGAEKTVAFSHLPARGLPALINQLKASGFTVAALEQVDGSQSLPSYRPPEKICLLVGSEIGGLDESVLALTDAIIEIPMAGQKESLNVSAAAAIALYHMRHGQG
jgi:23S rRNA (guanosine2251-2'-O)-methyltransferase